MAAPASAACPSSMTVSGWPSDAEAIQLENVVRRAHQRPFTLHLLESSQQELSEATGVFDLTDHWFDDPFARGIHGRTGLRVQFARHAVNDGGGLRQGTART